MGRFHRSTGPGSQGSRGNSAPVATTIEAAVRELCDASESNIIRSLRWVPKVSVSRVSRTYYRLGIGQGAFLDPISLPLYDLDALPSQDHRYKNAADDIWQHRVNNCDGDKDWVFYDYRFGLLSGADRDFLRFLCETVHPVVRPDTQQALEIVRLFNDELRPDGWELTRNGEIPVGPFSTLRNLLKASELFDQPTGWPKVDRQLGELQLKFREAANEEQFQAVGHLCRETLISVAQVVYQRERHPSLDGIEPSKTDAKRMLEAFVSVELAGSENAAVRKVAKAAFDLSNDLQHKRTATFREAALSTEATFTSVRIIALISGRRER